MQDIQRCMILSIVDEEYCLISTLVFVLVAFKHAVNYVMDDLDMPKLIARVKAIEQRFE